MKKKIMTVTLNPCIDKTIVLNEFCEGGLNRAETVRTDAGGKGINVSKVLRRFEADTVAVGVMGQGGSEAILSELKNREIACDFLPVSGTNRTNYKLQDRKKSQVTEVNEPGFSVSQEEVFQTISLIKQYLPQVGVMVLAGSFAPGFPVEIYKQLILLAKEQNVPVILDADGDAFSQALEAGPYAVKPNRFELEQFFGKPLRTDEDLFICGHKLIERGVSLVVISLGGDGALYVTKEEALRVCLAPISCESTVGAGDSMVAAVAHCLVEGKQLCDLAKMASAAGTVTASKPGTEVCTKEEVIKYQEKLQIIKL